VADFNKLRKTSRSGCLAGAACASHGVCSGRGIPEQNIRSSLQILAAGFGHKVPVYPGYVCAVVASLTLGVPVKWIETRSENLQSTGFARRLSLTADGAADKDGKVKAMRVKTLD